MSIVYLNFEKYRGIDDSGIILSLKFLMMMTLKIILSFRTNKSFYSYLYFI